jgi:AcrR family transcriptional regulator
MVVMARGPTAQGARTRETILRTAADLASVDGLGGLTIGALADSLQMSKSGLYAHFGSKEDLQLATIESARETYIREVIAPALAGTDGARRLVALADNFLDYLRREVFPGGCFFANAMAEFDCKPGPVRDRIAELQANWMRSLQRAATGAVAAGEMKSGTDTAQVAFDVESALLSANWYMHLFADSTYIDRARDSIRDRLDRDWTRQGRSAINNHPPGAK